MKNILLCTIILLSSAMLCAQPISGSSYDTKVESGARYMELGNYAAAREVLDEAYDDREDPELIPSLAEANYRLRDYRQAEGWYRRLLRRDSENEYIELRYDYAEVLKMQGKYDDAIYEFQQYLEFGEDPAKKQRAQLALTGAELGQSLPETSKGVSVEALDRRKVNTRTSEYSPALSPSGRVLYYSSTATKDIITADDKNDPEKFFLIYQSEITQKEGRDGEIKIEYSKPTALGPEINRPEYHSTNVSLSPDGRRMYFNRIKLGEGNVVQEAKIYLSEGGDGGWKSANEVVGVNGDFMALQPIVGELYGKEVLFFVSDMEGGEGGRDIYYATYQGEGVYGDPVNLGPSINTPGDEEGPFWFDGTLYFSSDGYPTLGGLDIFYAVWDGSTWSEPVNMGKAYNTPADEKYFRLFDDGYKGFFTSNRPEGQSVGGKTCCDDIYAFNIARRFVDLQVGTFDKEKREPLKGATVELSDITLIDAGENGVQSMTRDAGNVFGFDLAFNHEYTIIATHPDYYPDTATVTTMDLTDSKSFVERMFLEPKPKLPDSVTVYIDEAFVMENILYDFDDDKITQRAEIDLQTIYGLMTDYPEMKVELGSHTDARGDDNYNMDLSQRRAESARRWLMRKGIERSRIVAQGYGETEPKVIDSLLATRFSFLNEGDILTESYINALPTEAQQEEAHQLNRRTEFKVIEGPTSIRMKITRPASQENNDRGSNIGTGRTLRNDPPTIDPLSSLYGQKDLAGVPVMQFEERRYQLGPVQKGDKRSFTYTFVNRGDAELIIDLVSACDCTSTNQDELIGKIYKPGEGGTLKVTFDSADKDEAETIDIDIYLRNNDKEGNPIMEMLQYSFELE